MADGNMTHYLDDLATEHCSKGRDPLELQFFGDYDRRHYDDGYDGGSDGNGGDFEDDNDGDSLHSDIQ